MREKFFTKSNPQLRKKKIKDDAVSETLGAFRGCRIGFSKAALLPFWAR